MNADYFADDLLKNVKISLKLVSGFFSFNKFMSQMALGEGEGLVFGLKNKVVGVLYTRRSIWKMTLKDTQK